ncbi:UDP-N-acetylenolpyruvoylglucosamine reductase [Ichthyobacterium seriolicida]|uniref:UDP-N-acetylenolpyruvoylglucosamine reductase n=2 Tax=Ichthyobacterium seriolicida TaxID=242600 RepID=A0A1J1E4U2_9FLAO|nr:UDP-N-acetylenolpyruvoylglucosamine reductase [Ichthyobacterium seriolicida]
MILENISLKKYNTFGVDITAKCFLEIKCEEQLREVLLQNDKPKFVLGGGSNILFTKNLDRLVLRISNKGKKILKEDRDSILVKVESGEIWSDFVVWCINNDLGGLENLSSIPGNVGSAPIQNIGAYGVEVKNYIENLEAIEIATGKKKVFSNTECEFGYRDSIFKQRAKNNYVIISVTFKLTKKSHTIKSSYGDIKCELQNKKIENPSIKDISEIVTAIRKRKLPDPLKIGNGGSFFKNATIPKSHFNHLKESYPKIPNYPDDNNNLVKISSAWLIEQCGFKGHRIGDAGVSCNQALILVNYGNASGGEILSLANDIRQSVQTKFNINLETEVNIIT